MVSNLSLWPQLQQIQLSWWISRSRPWYSCLSDLGPPSMPLERPEKQIKKENHLNRLNWNIFHGLGSDSQLCNSWTYWSRFFQLFGTLRSFKSIHYSCQHNKETPSSHCDRHSWYVETVCYIKSWATSPMWGGIFGHTAHNNLRPVALSQSLHLALMMQHVLIPHRGLTFYFISHIFTKKEAGNKSRFHIFIPS